MSAEVVNLRKARKAKARAEKETRAEENRARFGRTKAERKRDGAEADILSRHVEGHRREKSEKRDT